MCLTCDKSCFLKIILFCFTVSTPRSFGGWSARTIHISVGWPTWMTRQSWDCKNKARSAGVMRGYHLFSSSFVVRLELTFCPDLALDEVEVESWVPVVRKINFRPPYFWTLLTILAFVVKASSKNIDLTRKLVKVTWQTTYHHSGSFF